MPTWRITQRNRTAEGRLVLIMNICSSGIMEVFQAHKVRPGIKADWNMNEWYIHKLVIQTTVVVESRDDFMPAFVSLHLSCQSLYCGRKKNSPILHSQTCHWGVYKCRLVLKDMAQHLGFTWITKLEHNVFTHLSSSWCLLHSPGRYPWSPSQFQQERYHWP